MKVKEESENAGLKLNIQINKDHGIQSHQFMANRWGNNGNCVRLYFLGLQNHCRWWLQPWNQKTLAPWKKSYDQPRQHIKKQRHYCASKGPSNQSYGFSSSHVCMWELDYKESCMPKNWCFWTVVLEKTLENLLDCVEIKPVHSEGNQSWIFIGRTDVEAETPILWPPEAKNWLIGKDPDDGKDWRQEEKGMTEDKMVGWHHWFYEHEFEQASGIGDGQGSLACCSPWGCKESDRTEQLNGTDMTTDLAFLFFLLTSIPLDHPNRLHLTDTSGYRAWEISFVGVNPLRSRGESEGKQGNDWHSISMHSRAN